jgi:hypothetical protein
MNLVLIQRNTAVEDLKRFIAARQSVARLSEIEDYLRGQMLWDRSYGAIVAGIG